MTRKTLPVEVWKRNLTWTFQYDSTEELASVVIDPDYVFPDSNSSNNKWKATDNTPIVEDLTGYIGAYSAPGFPIKVTITEDSGALVIEAEGQPAVSLENEGGGAFTMDEASFY